MGTTEMSGKSHCAGVPLSRGDDGGSRGPKRPKRRRSKVSGNAANAKGGIAEGTPAVRTSRRLCTRALYEGTGPRVDPDRQAAWRKRLTRSGPDYPHHLAVPVDDHQRYLDHVVGEHLRVAAFHLEVP